MEERAEKGHVEYLTRREKKLERVEPHKDAFRLYARGVRILKDERGLIA
jgi:hypothetical protein